MTIRLAQSRFLLTIFSLIAVLQPSAAAQQKSQPGSGAQASARFRVTLNGFAVNNQSDDDILEGDGKGDEIYLRADFWEMNKNGVATKHTLRSATLGDVNNQPNRKQAGSASSKGGLRTNDKYPTDQPWARGALQTMELPMLLWMGTLTQGEDGVAIFPTVWEWDSPNASPSENEWDKSLDTFFSTLKRHLLLQLQQRVKGTEFNMATALSDNWIWGNADDGYGVGLRDKAGTRPIGLYRLRDRPVVFAPKILPLNYDSALEATRTSPSNNGLGVFAFRYTDEQDHGDYTLYVQVEKLN
jgi:hypothetical protein